MDTPDIAALMRAAEEAWPASTPAEKEARAAAFLTFLETRGVTEWRDGVRILHGDPRDREYPVRG